MAYEIVQPSDHETQWIVLGVALAAGVIVALAIPFFFEVAARRVQRRMDRDRGISLGIGVERDSPVKKADGTDLDRHNWTS